MSRLPAVPVDAALVVEAIDLADRWSLSQWDAPVVAAARREGWEQLLSEDLASGSTVAGVEIVNPLVD